MNTPTNISTREWTRQLEPREISARDCEDKCCYGNDPETWHSAEDKWFCVECLELYYQNELDHLLDMPRESYVFIVGPTDDLDDFTHFTSVDAFGGLLTITRYQLEEVRRNNKGAE